MERNGHDKPYRALTGRHARAMVPAMNDRPTTNPRHLLVEMFSGHKGEPTPRAFTHEGIRLEVRQIVAHWETAHHSVFQVIASDGYRYTLRCHLDDLAWELVMREVSVRTSP